MPFGKRRRQRREEEMTSDLPEGQVSVVRREDRKDGRQEYKLAKIDVKTDRALAVAAKRNATAGLLKWLVILIGVGYTLMNFGGSFGGLSKVFQFFGGGE